MSICDSIRSYAKATPQKKFDNLTSRSHIEALPPSNIRHLSDHTESETEIDEHYSHKQKRATVLEGTSLRAFGAKVGSQLLTISAHFYDDSAQDHL